LALLSDCFADWGDLTVENTVSWSSLLELVPRVAKLERGTAKDVFSSFCLEESYELGAEMKLWAREIWE
jgi:hypothetical protein